MDLAERAMSQGAEERSRALRSRSGDRRGRPIRRGGDQAPRVGRAEGALGSQQAARLAEGGAPHQQQQQQQRVGPELDRITRALADVFDQADNTFGLQRQDITRLQTEAIPMELIQAFFPALVRMTLRNTQSIAALEATAFHHIHLEKKHQICQAMRITSQFFVQEATRLRRENAQALREKAKVPELDALGVPRPHLWLALLGAVRQQGERVGAANAEVIADYLDAVKADGSMTNEKMCDTVRHCRISYTHDRKTMKIHISAESSGVVPQLLDSLKQLGAEIKRGTPPRSHNERIMQLLLDHAEM
ncbi:unnamed protein product [Prorocentrum cordatum]|uniref:RNA helicase n=1 Tax=Prorocentrum cordatum TaxID=2364126 RepID=A0ABN9VQY6_9DINO|nr:unnamed protein product [Polarella glacialis]